MTFEIKYLSFFSIDAINSTCQARFVNDSSKFSTACNSKMELLQVEGRTRLCLFASKDIQAGDEILYDYGDKNKNLWWRAKVNNISIFLIVCSVGNWHCHQQFNMHVRGAG